MSVEPVSETRMQNGSKAITDSDQSTFPPAMIWPNKPAPEVVNAPKSLGWPDYPLSLNMAKSSKYETAVVEAFEGVEVRLGN